MINPAKSLFKKAYDSRHLNKWVVRLYGRLYPPPYCRDNIEFDRDVWNGICTFRSATGRHIGENNTNPKFYREMIETKHLVCAFEGSRNGRQVNITALRHMIPIWDDVLQFTLLMRNHYIEHRELHSARLNLRQGYVFSKMTAAYLSFLARRTRNPLSSGTLPALETAYFTVGVGPFMVVRALMERGNLAALETAPMSAAALYDLADSSGSLLAGTDRACAGSKHLIVQFLDVAMNGAYTQALTSADAQRALSCIDDWNTFYQYLYASSRLELLIKLNQALCAQLLVMLLSDPGTLSEVERQHLQASLARCYFKVKSPLDDSTVLRNFIQIALALLDELAYPAVQASLMRASLLPNGDWGLPTDTTRKSVAAQRIRQSTQLIYPFCDAELNSLNKSLGRHSAARISMDDLYHRLGGPEISALLTLLESA